MNVDRPRRAVPGQAARRDTSLTAATANRATRSPRDRGAADARADSAALVIAELFGPAIHGDGPSSGRLAAFIRLSRCNLACRECDVPYTWDRARYDLRTESHRASAAEITDWVLETGVECVVITGGEPLLQQHRLMPLVQALGEHGRWVEVETNGTVEPLPRLLELVDLFNVSPKLSRFCDGISEDRRICADPLRAFARSGKAIFTFVVVEPAELDEVMAVVHAHGLGEVWVMPEGSDARTVLRRLRLLAEPTSRRGFHLTSRLHILLQGDDHGP